jgi:hypothetical protein
MQLASIYEYTSKLNTASSVLYFSAFNNVVHVAIIIDIMFLIQNQTELGVNMNSIWFRMRNLHYVIHKVLFDDS